MGKIIRVAPGAGEDILARAKHVLETGARAILELKDSLGTEFIRAAQLIFDARGRIVVTGMGKSGIIAKKVAATFASTGTPALFVHAAEASHGDLGMISQADLVIAISNSGETDELLALLPTLKVFNNQLIALVGRRESTLARHADVVLEVRIADEGCPLNLAPMTSTTAALALGDALAAAVMQLRNFRREDYAVLHPKGSLGRRLLTKVRDIMVSGDKLPLVRPEYTLKTVIHEMIASNLGMAIAVTDDGKLAGILSDGDIKRLLEAKGDFFSKKMADVMTRDPISTTDETLAETALRAMEYNKRRQITVMPVLDAAEKVVGLIRMHDILQAKIR
jgi:arabinose-5-phosphate isomerase